MTISLDNILRNKDITPATRAVGLGIMQWETYSLDADYQEYLANTRAISQLEAQIAQFAFFCNEVRAKMKDGDNRKQRAECLAEYEDRMAGYVARRKELEKINQPLVAKYYI